MCAVNINTSVLPCRRTKNPTSIIAPQELSEEQIRDLEDEHMLELIEKFQRSAINTGSAKITIHGPGSPAWSITVNQYNFIDSEPTPPSSPMVMSGSSIDNPSQDAESDTRSPMVVNVPRRSASLAIYVVERVRGVLTVRPQTGDGGGGASQKLYVTFRNGHWPDQDPLPAAEILKVINDIGRNLYTDSSDNVN